MNRSEAGKIGGLKTGKKLHQDKLDRLEQEKKEYEDNPKYCLCCGNKLSFEKRFNKFCNKSCAVTYNNTLRKSKELKNNCINCGCPTNNAKFCSNKCQQEYENNLWIEKWKNGQEDGICGKFGTSGKIKKYFIKKYDNRCQLCGWHELNIYTNKVPLELHHIDGDFRNNKEENLQLLCPNCHSLTPNFKASNKNGTRKDRIKK